MKNIIAAHRHINEFARELSERCGKSAAFLRRDIIRAKRLNHISLDEYEWVRYYDMTKAQKKSVSTLWTRAEFRKRFTSKHYKAVLMNKYIFAKVFSEYFGRGFALTEGMSREDFARLSKSGGKVVYKPLAKGQSKGVRVFPASNEHEIEASYSEIMRLKPGMVEEWITQHEDMARIYPGAVNIIRFYSVCSPAGAYIFAPVLTVSKSKSVSNGSNDALTAMVDIRTGVVLTDAVDQLESVTYAAHPVTGVAFKGLTIPYWRETLAMLKKLVPQAHYISNVGWDVAITPTGPVIIEGNTIPGFNTAQFHGFAELTEGYGYQPLFDEAMKEVPFTALDRYAKVLIKIA